MAITHKGTQNINTEHLLIRPFTEGDLALVFDDFAGDKNAKYFGIYNIYGRDRDEIATLAKSWLYSYRFAHSYLWAIEKDGKVVGTITVVRLIERNFAAELGAFINSDVYSVALLTEAIVAVKDYLFEEVGLHRIFAGYKTDDTDIGEALKSADFVFEGVSKDAWFDGEFSDLAQYGIVSEVNN